MCSMADRADWLEWRQAGIGSSDVGAILGVSPFAGEFDVWISKTRPVAEKTDAVKTRGHRLEPAVLAWMQEELGGAMVPGSPRVRPGDGNEWMRASPDGWCVFHHGDPDREHWLLCEAKTSIDRPWPLLPLYYELQCLWLMCVTETDSCALGAFFVRYDEWKIWRVERDLAVEAKMIERLRAWWERHVVGGEPPPLKGPAARRWLRDEFAEGEGWLEGTDEHRLLAVRYENAARAEREARARKDELGLKLREAIGKHVGLEGNDWRLKWSRFMRRGLDRERLLIDRPDLAEVLETYTTESPTGRLYYKTKRD